MASLGSIGNRFPVKLIKIRFSGQKNELYRFILIVRQSCIGSWLPKICSIKYFCIILKIHQLYSLQCSQSLTYNMKVVKHLRQETPEHRLKVFFREMPIITKALLLTIPVATILLTIFHAPHATLNFYSFFDARPIPEMILLLIVAATDFQREEQSGSLYFLATYIFKISVVAGMRFIMGLLVFGEQQSSSVFVSTSYPMLFCLMSSMRDMMVKPAQIRYFLIDPFQIKCLFYPIFLTVLLQLMGWRIDVLYVVVLAALLLLLKKMESCVKGFCKKIESKVVSQKMVEKGVRLTDCTEGRGNEMDLVVTSNSIVLQQP